MNSINSRFLSLLAGALCMSVLWTSCANAMSKSYARESHGSKTQSNESKKETKQMGEAALLKKAYKLAEAIAHENDRTNKVQVASIIFELLPSVKFAQNVVGFSKMSSPNSRGRNQTVRIQLSRALKQNSIALQIQTILHELAHAYDKHLWDVVAVEKNETSFDSYRFLKNDMLACQKKWNKAAPEMSSKEWYAEWQSIQWMKKYAPKHVAVLKEEFNEWAQEDKHQGVSSLVYPPADILLKWLSE